MLTKTTNPNNNSVTLQLSGVSSVFSNVLACRLFHCKQNEKFRLFAFCLNTVSALPTRLIEMQNQPDH